MKVSQTIRMTRVRRADGHEAFTDIGLAWGMDRAPLVSKVVGAVAEVEGVDPAELDLVLHDHVETDALEALDRHPGDSWTLRFEASGHTVTVTGDGSVLVDGQRREPVWP